MVNRIVNSKVTTMFATSRLMSTAVGILLFRIGRADDSSPANATMTNAPRASPPVDKFHPIVLPPNETPKLNVHRPVGSDAITDLLRTYEYMFHYWGCFGSQSLPGSIDKNRAVEPTPYGSLGSAPSRRVWTAISGANTIALEIWPALSVSFRTPQT